MQVLKKPNPKIFETGPKVKPNICRINPLIDPGYLEATFWEQGRWTSLRLHFNANNEPEHEYCGMIYRFKVK